MSKILALIPGGELIGTAAPRPLTDAHARQAWWSISQEAGHADATWAWGQVLERLLPLVARVGWAGGLAQVWPPAHSTEHVSFVVLADAGGVLDGLFPSDEASRPEHDQDFRLGPR